MSKAQIHNCNMFLAAMPATHKVMFQEAKQVSLTAEDDGANRADAIMHRSSGVMAIIPSVDWGRSVSALRGAELKARSLRGDTAEESSPSEMHFEPSDVDMLEASVVIVPNTFNSIVEYGNTLAFTRRRSVVTVVYLRQMKSQDLNQLRAPLRKRVDRQLASEFLAADHAGIETSFFGDMNVRWFFLSFALFFLASLPPFLSSFLSFFQRPRILLLFFRSRCWTPGWRGKIWAASCDTARSRRRRARGTSEAVVIPNTGAMTLSA